MSRQRPPIDAQKPEGPLELRAPPRLHDVVTAVLAGEYDLLGFSCRNPVVLDIGANVGAFSVWASYRYPGAKIYAYEPQPELQAMLEENTRECCEPSATVFLHAFALRGPGCDLHQLLWKGVENEGCAGLHNLDHSDEPPITVTCSSAALCPAANVIKVDTEGCELEILEALDLSEASVVSVEFHREGDRHAIARLLEPHFVLARANVQIPELGVLTYLRRDLWEARA